MCDSILLREGGSIWLAKNSDREPGEAQAVEWHAAGSPDSTRRRSCTHLWVDDRQPRRAVVISRPAWMWGAEMGVNASGLAITNEATFTRMPVAAAGLTGMDLLRLALERADTAQGALNVIVELLGRHPQGGRMGYRDRGFRYHSSFLIADGSDAWALETAGRFWAARRVTGSYTSSNILSIGRNFDRIHPRAAAYARSQGWSNGGGDFDFADAFAQPWLARAANGKHRQRCTSRWIAPPRQAPLPTLIDALRSHEGHHPADGWRMAMPCAHASWQPTRNAGQTTGSMIARAGGAPRVWMTGTSAPCLSVFKPVAVDRHVISSDAATTSKRDDSLWWAHEAFHRAALADYGRHATTGASARSTLQSRAQLVEDPEHFAALWEEHRELAREWAKGLRGGSRRRSLFQLYWRWQSRKDSLPTRLP